MRDREEDEFYSFFTDNEPDDDFTDFTLLRNDKVIPNILGKHSWTSVTYYYYATILKKTCDN